MKYACIEGPGFAGKSTLAKQLVEHYDAMYIGEYMDYATINGRTGFPPLPDTIEEAKAAIDFFVDIERERSRDVRKHITGGRKVFGDRSIISLAAYQLALDRQKSHLPGNQIAVPDYTFEVLDRAIKKGDVELPERLLLLRVASRTVHENRVKRRGGETTMGAFNHWFFSRALTEATQEASELLLPADIPIRSLISHEGDNGLAVTMQEAINFLDAPVLEAEGLRVPQL